MVLALTCALCVADPAALPRTPEPVTLLEIGLRRPDAAPHRTSGPFPLALGDLADRGSGDGDHSDHGGGHMGPMWILMGVMMAVMMVGMGVYLMRNGATGQTHAPTSSLSPAQLALPVSPGRSGGG